MFVQLKTGYNTDQGPAWISRVRFTKSWQTAYWHGKTLRRQTGLFDANFYDVETHEEYWLSGPHRDQGDSRYSNIRPEIDDDVRAVYEAFLAGTRLVAPWSCSALRWAERLRRDGKKESSAETTLLGYGDSTRSSPVISWQRIA